jgi:ATP-dependent RNA helicase RhlB
MLFDDLDLHPDLKRGLAEAGYITCMPVQEQVLTGAFGGQESQQRGQDLYVQSQTGTGKTAAFLIVIYQRLLTESLLTGKKALIMVPTRELAVQVEKEALTLAKYLPFKAGSFYGGVGYAQQHQLLKENVQIMVGTPGRVLDLNKTGHMNLMELAFLVLDEADRMFDMGFYPDLRKLIRVVPPADRRQTMLFSATLNAWVKNLAWEYTKNPKEIEIEPETVTVDEVEQLLYHVHSEDKMKLLMGIMERENPESAIIFCNTKRYVEIIAKRLRHNGIECQFIIGDLPQVKRLKIIDDIKAGRTRFLVATDVAARGLDIEALSMVVNYDLPVEAENYVHRIGRTARAGKTGKAFTLASEMDVYELADIEKYIGKKIPSEIASEALYGQDKSAGIRIRTDSYDDRGRGKDSGRDRARGGDRGKGRDTRRGQHATGRSAPAGRGTTPRNGAATERSPRSAATNGATTVAPPPPSAAKAAQPRHAATAAATLPRAEKPAVTKSSRGQRGGKSGTRPNLSQLTAEERMAYYKEKYEKQDGQDNRRKFRQNEKPKPAAARGHGRANTAAPEPGAKQEKPKRGVLGKVLGLFKKK